MMKIRRPTLIQTIEIQPSEILQARDTVETDITDFVNLFDNPLEKFAILLC